MNSLVSIIIPTYNRAHLISETLDSILEQTYTNWECIVVDDGSIDNTAAVLAQYIEKDNRFQYYQRPENRKKGANTCRNYGFELSKGDYIKWFDSDDIMLFACLEKQIISIGNNADVSVCKLLYYDFEKGIGIRESKMYSNNLIEDYLIGNIAFYVSGPLWKQSFLMKQEQLFDDEISNLDDWDFNLRMLYEDPIITYLNEPLVQYRVHEMSLSGEVNKLNFQEVQSEFKAIRKHLFLIKQNKKANPQVLKRYLKKRHQFILRAALIENNQYKFYYLKQLLLLELQFFQFLEVIKTIIGFTVYIFFKRGYKLL